MDLSSIPILDSIDLSAPIQTVTERYYTPLYYRGKNGEDQLILQHSNKLYLISLAPSHPIIAENKKITKIDFNIGPNSNRLVNNVSGKGKKGAQFLQPDSTICFIETEDGGKFEIFSCVKGKLVEVNENVVQNPQVLVTNPSDKGYIAIVLGPLSDKHKVHEKLVLVVSPMRKKQQNSQCNERTPDSFSLFRSKFEIIFPDMNFVTDLIRPHATIPPFNDDGVRQLLDEMETLYRENLRDSVDPTLYPTVLIRHSYLERRKRYLLAYLKNRLDEISTIRWELGSILPNDVKTQLCEPEVQWFNKYSKALSQYMKSIGEGTGLDLTQNQQPPKTPYILVKVLEDIGEIQNEYDETLVLKPGTVHYLPKGICEQFIHEGMMEHIPIS